MHFESIFFFNLENGLFQTHPPTKSGKFQNFFFLFLTPSLIQKINILICFLTHAHERLRPIYAHASLIPKEGATH